MVNSINHSSAVIETGVKSFPVPQGAGHLQLDGPDRSARQERPPQWAAREEPLPLFPGARS